MLLSMHAGMAMARLGYRLSVSYLLGTDSNACGPYMSMLVVCVFVCLSVYLLFFFKFFFKFFGAGFS